MKDSKKVTVGNTDPGAVGNVAQRAVGAPVSRPTPAPPTSMADRAAADPVPEDPEVVMTGQVPVTSVGRVQGVIQPPEGVREQLERVRAKYAETTLGREELDGSL